MKIHVFYRYCVIFNAWLHYLMCFEDYFIYLGRLWFVLVQRIKPFTSMKCCFYVLRCWLLAVDHILILSQKPFLVCCYSTFELSTLLRQVCLQSPETKLLRFYSSHTLFRTNSQKASNFTYFKPGLETFVWHILIKKNIGKLFYFNPIYIALCFFHILF